MKTSECDVTAVIKTFERPQCLQRLLQSIRRYYPDLRVVVADDSRVPARAEGVTVLELPYDVGLSAGRNAGVDAVDTEFCVILDDDFILGPKTNLEVLVGHLRRDPGLDIVGGAVDNVGRGIWKFYGNIETTPRGHVVHRLKQAVHGIVRCDVIPNFFAARVSALRRVRWDPDLKLAEHVDFFARAKGVLGVAYCPEVVVTHDRHCDSAVYTGLRGRSSEYFRLYMRKHGFTTSPQKTESRSRRLESATRRGCHGVDERKPGVVADRPVPIRRKH